MCTLAIDWLWKTIKMGYLSLLGVKLVRGRTGSRLPELPFKTVHEFCSHTAPQ